MMRDMNQEALSEFALSSTRSAWWPAGGQGELCLLGDACRSDWSPFMRPLLEDTVKGLFQSPSRGGDTL